jgi:2-polyprenyl-3-methyl-5-hydroxy-6-metoxy-1,4-benzoquinol methylase
MKLNIIDYTPFRGKHCYVAPFTKGKLIKIFDAYPQKELTDDGLKSFLWGDLPVDDGPTRCSRLLDASKIQNFCFLEGLAPRVFDVVGVRVGQNFYYAQVVEDMGEVFKEDQRKADEIYGKVKAIGEVYGFHTDRDDVSGIDVKDGKLLDFNTFHLSDNHTEKIRALYCTLARYGKVYYQDIPELNLQGGPRKSLSRVEDMQLGKIDFTQKSVADFGCAGGFFCRYAASRGAREVLGVDYEDVVGTNSVKAASIIANELEYFNIEFEAHDLRSWTPDWKWDITFFLSMNYHVGIPEWLPRVTEKLCVFEDNSKGRDALPTLERMFSKVELVGNAHDHGEKPIYHCYR